MTGMKEEHISYALQSTHAQGNPEKAFDMLLLLEDSIEGILRGYTPSTKLLGAENRKGVTCYLDALLFAMFARLDCFEPILNRTFEDAHLRKLVVLLRLWVNMLRSGKLITADIVCPPSSQNNGSWLTGNRQSICKKHSQNVAGKKLPLIVNKMLQRRLPS